MCRKSLDGAAWRQHTAVVGPSRSNGQRETALSIRLGLFSARQSGAHGARKWAKGTVEGKLGRCGSRPERGSGRGLWRAVPVSAAQEPPAAADRSAAAAATPRQTRAGRPGSRVGHHARLEPRSSESIDDDDAPLGQVIDDTRCARLTKAGDFFSGAEVTLNLGNRSLPPGALAGLRSLLTDRFGLLLVPVQTTAPEMREAALNSR